MFKNDSDAILIAQRAMEAVSILIDRVEALENEIKQLKATQDGKKEKLGCTVIPLYNKVKNTAKK